MRISERNLRFNTGWNAAKNLTESPPYFINSLCCTCFLTCCIHITQNNLMTQKVHHSIRPVSTHFQSSSCVIWHVSVFSPRFTSFRMASWQEPFYWNHLWWGFVASENTSFRSRVRFLWIFFPISKGHGFQILFVGLSLLLLSSTRPVFSVYLRTHFSAHHTEVSFWLTALRESLCCWKNTLLYHQILLSLVFFRDST